MSCIALNHSFIKTDMFCFFTIFKIKLYVFRYFLDELEDCSNEAIAMAQCFLNNKEGFVIYTDYCTNYPR